MPTTSHAPTCCGASCATSPTRTSARCRAAASCGTRTRPVSPAASRSTTTAATSSTSTAARSLFELPAYGGSNCAARVSWLRGFGGWNENTVTEDTDLTLRMVLVGRRCASTSPRSTPRRASRPSGGSGASATGGPAATSRPGVSTGVAMWRSKNLSFARRVESIMFLLVYHVPVFCMLGLVLRLPPRRRRAHVGQRAGPHARRDAAVPRAADRARLGADRQPRAPSSRAGILLFLPTFVLFTVVCTKSWFDGILGRPYTWVKTPRSGVGQDHTVAVLS